VLPSIRYFGSRLFGLVQLVFARRVKAWLAGASGRDSALGRFRPCFSLIGTNCAKSGHCRTRTKTSRLGRKRKISFRDDMPKSGPSRPA